MHFETSHTYTGAGISLRLRVKTYCTGVAVGLVVQLAPSKLEAKIPGWGFPTSKSRISRQGLMENIGNTMIRSTKTT